MNIIPATLYGKYDVTEHEMYTNGGQYAYAQALKNIIDQLEKAKAKRPNSDNLKIELKLYQWEKTLSQTHMKYTVSIRASAYIEDPKLARIGETVNTRCMPSYHFWEQIGHNKDRAWRRIV